MLALDRTLASYGPEAADARSALRDALARRIELIWPADHSRGLAPGARGGIHDIETLATRIRRLSPNNDDQRRLQSRAVELGESLFHCGRREDARQAFARVLRFDPDHVGALYFDGVLLAEARYFDAALDRWSNVIALEPAGDFARRARRDTRTALDLQRIFSARDTRVLGAA